MEQGKNETYLHQLPAMAERLVEDVPYKVSNLANVSALLMQTLPGLNWVGFYLMDARGETLYLGPFQGKTACVAIPVGKGVCGTAAQRGETLRVADVHAFPGHIACDSASASEMVVPVRSGGRVVAVLDADSPESGHFTPEAQQALEAVAALLGRRWAGMTDEAC